MHNEQHEIFPRHVSGGAYRCCKIAHLPCRESLEQRGVFVQRVDLAECVDWSLCVYGSIIVDAENLAVCGLLSCLVPECHMQAILQPPIPASHTTRGTSPRFLQPRIQPTNPSSMIDS